jgi:Domain of Unknown Function with PDB structure (DUF3857)
MVAISIQATLMRNSLFICCTVGLFAALSPALLCAQFQPPNPDELKMTSDPKAPGAAAEYLEYREKDDSGSAYWTFYARIKVLTDKGKEAATVTLPFSKGSVSVRGIHARTIHSDGTVFPLEVKPEELLSVKTGKLEVKQKVFTLPNVEVGSVIEYTYDYNSQDLGLPRWDIQKKYFVRKEHFEIVSPGRLTYWERLPAGAAVKAEFGGLYKLDLADVPAIPDEEWMPPVDSLLYTVDFDYVSDFQGGSVEEGSATAMWAAEAASFSQVVNAMTEPTKGIKQAVDGLISADSDLVKARKLYAAVQALDNTDFSRVKGETERKKLKLKADWDPEVTWQQKSGSAEQIAILYISMLRAAGLAPYAAWVVDRDKGIFDMTKIGEDQFDSILVILNSGDQRIILDPGEKECPFQTVSWRHSLATGLAQSPKGPSFITIPEQKYADNIVRRTGILTLDEKGGVSGQIQIAMTGQEALRWRQLALENDLSEVKKQFDGELADIAPNGVQADVDHFEGMDDPTASLNAVIKLTGSLGVPAGRRLIVPTYFFETRGTVPFVNEAARQVPVDMHYAERVTDQITYRLPDGLAVEGAPADANFSWPAHALFVAKSLTQPGQITIAQTLTRAFTIVKPEEYQDLRGFYQKVAAADQAQLVLTAATKNGN